MRTRVSREQQREYERRWRLRHPDTVKAKKQRWYQGLKADPERLARHQQYQREYKTLWEWEKRKEWTWIGFCFVKKRVQYLQEPLPRYDEVGLPYALCSFGEQSPTLQQ